MGKIIRNLLRGVGSAMEIAPVGHYVRRGFSDDANSLRSDWRRVGDDMRKALEKHGQQANDSKAQTR